LINKKQNVCWREDRKNQRIDTDNKWIYITLYVERKGLSLFVLRWHDSIANNTQTIWGQNIMTQQKKFLDKTNCINWTFQLLSIGKREKKKGPTVSKYLSNNIFSVWDRMHPSQKFQKYNTKTINITLVSQLVS